METDPTMASASCVLRSGREGEGGELAELDHVVEEMDSDARVAVGLSRSPKKEVSLEIG